MIDEKIKNSNTFDDAVAFVDMLDSYRLYNQGDKYNKEFISELTKINQLSNSAEILKSVDAIDKFLNFDTSKYHNGSVNYMSLLNNESLQLVNDLYNKAHKLSKKNEYKKLNRKFKGKVALKSWLSKYKIILIILFVLLLFCSIFIDTKAGITQTT